MSLRVPRILIVEDDAGVSRAFARAFRIELEAMCDIVDNAEAAVAIINAGGNYDAVISDWNLAGALNGESVFIAMKALGLQNKFVFCTSEERVIELHDAVAIKPCKMPDLYALVRAAIASKPQPRPSIITLENL